MYGTRFKSEENNILSYLGQPVSALSLALREVRVVRTGHLLVYTTVSGPMGGTHLVKNARVCYPPGFKDRVGVGLTRSTIRPLLPSLIPVNGASK